MHAAPPTTKPDRAPKTSEIHPMIGPPIGVDPRKTIACRASTRPRICGSARSWSSAVDDVMNMMLARPTRIANGNATSRFGADASSNIATPKPNAATTTWRSSTDSRRAAHSDPATEPTLTTENSSVNICSSPSRARVTNSGNVTEKLNASVPMTAIITSEIQRSGVRRVYRKPSFTPPRPRAAGGAGRSSDGRIM